MFQSRTHNCGELRMDNIGQTVTIAGWMENMREVGQNFAFVIVRDFYGTTQVVVDTEEGIHGSGHRHRAGTGQQEPEDPHR